MLGVIHYNKIKQHSITTSIFVGISFAAFCLFSAIFTMPATVHASNLATATASVTVESTCSMTATVTSEHTATMVNGTYSGTEYPNGIGSTTIQTFCNDRNGYSILAVGYTNNEEGNTVMKGGATLTSSDDIVTGTATSGTSGSDVSNWAMKVSPVAGTYAPTIQNGFDSFSAVPSTYTAVARFDGPTDSASGSTHLGSSITTTYAAYISNTQAPGTYTGQVRYVLVHPNYNESGTYVMQDIANWKGSIIPEVQFTVTDSRDNKTYTAVKTSDGNIWMTQNLDLCIGCNGTAALTSENTDLNQYDTNGDGTGTVFYGYSKDSNNVITWTPNGTTVTGSPATISDFSYSSSATTAVSNWTNDYNAPYMAEGSTTISYGTGENATIYSNLAACTGAGYSESLCKHNQYGNYYNWSAAVAMNDTSAYTTKYTVMPNSICPAGWRLPNGLTQTNSTVNISDFNSVLNTYSIANGNDATGNTNVGYQAGGFNKILGDPLFMTRAGFVVDTTLYDSGASGNYWSSTVVSDSQAYGLGFSSSGLYPAYQNNRDRGRSVRCVSAAHQSN